MSDDSQQFLRELDKKLWTAANKLQSNLDAAVCKHAAGTEILKERGRPARSYKITSTGKLVDDALEAVEKENPKLKNVLNKNYTQLQIDPANLAGLIDLIDLIATILFQHVDLHAKDILGHQAESALSNCSSAPLGGFGAFIEADLVECMVALPGQLFTNTQIPACIWFLTENKAKRSRSGAAALRERRKSPIGENICLFAA